MNFPLISEYIESIKMAEDNFATLVNLRPVLDDNGEPIMSSGNFAVVFKMEDFITNEVFAVKCFTKDQEGRDEAYQAIAKEMEKIESPYFVKMQYLEKELFVNSSVSSEEEFPVVVMDWVDGLTLDQYIKNNIDDRYALELLSYCFCQLAYWLVQQPFAHGDLKPDNIIVRDNGMLTLVDYDGMYVPEMFDQKARELGSPNFRHPNRTTSDFDSHIDDLPLVSIALALRMIWLDKKWFEEYSDSEHFIFQASDFANIVRSEVFQKLYDSVSDRVSLGLINLLLLVCKENAIIKENYNTFIFDAPTLRNKKYKELYWQLAQNGNWEIQALYGGELCRGVILEKQVVDGITLIYDSINNGCERALNILGNCYKNGFGVSFDINKAIKLYSKAAAEQGNIGAKRALGVCYIKGDGVPKDATKALKLFILTAGKGDCMSQFNLGLCYEKGEGLTKDVYKAIQWYLKAAQQGFIPAQNNLGLCYIRVKDYKKAVYWFSKAAEEGNAYSQCSLGVCYEKGKGIEKNINKAKEWYKKAANQGHEKAIKKLKELQ